MGHRRQHTPSQRRCTDANKHIKRFSTSYVIRKYKLNNNEILLLWSGLPFLTRGYLPDPGINPVSPALAGSLFTTEPLGKPNMSIRMAKIWKTDTTKCWQVCGATGTLIHCWWKCKQTRWPLTVSYSTKLTLTIWSSNCTPCHLPKGDENLRPCRNLHTDT